MSNAAQRYKKANDVLPMMGLNETIVQLVMANYLLVWLCIEEGE